MSTNCSLRITRSTEDLAKTIALISKRLISLEERINILETNKEKISEESLEQIEMLESVEQLMNNCRELLEPNKYHNELKQNWESKKSDDTFAA